MLCDWSEQPAFQVRYRWSKGAVGLWDNRATMHFAINDYQEPRVIERVTVLGDVPTGPPPRWGAFRSDAHTSGSSATPATPSKGIATDPRTNSIAKPA
jgi:taurine dioxygenase